MVCYWHLQAQRLLSYSSLLSVTWPTDMLHPLAASVRFASDPVALQLFRLALSPQAMMSETISKPRRERAALLLGDFAWQ